MTQVASELAHLPNAQSIIRVAFVGTTSSTLSGLSTAADISDGWGAYGTTLSAFAVPWNGYLVQLLNETTGASFVYVNPTTNDESPTNCADV